MQNAVDATKGVGGEMGEVALLHAFSCLLFGSFNACTAKSEKRGFLLCFQKTCFGGTWMATFGVILRRGWVTSSSFAKTIFHRPQLRL